MTLKEDCKENVLKYLVVQNRPYSANDIIQNLHNEYGRTSVQKALDLLTLENRIREKTYGKQKVYSCLQEDENQSSELDSKVRELDSKVEKALERLTALEEELNNSEKELKSIERQPTNEAALREKSELEETVVRLKKEFDELSQRKINISNEDKLRLDSDHSKLFKECRKRKNICMDIVHSILESYPKKMKVLIEEIGIETDEDLMNSS